MYPNHPLCPQTPVSPTSPIPVPVVSPEVMQELMAAKDAAYHTALQNEHLQQQLKEKALREDAYTVAYTANQRTWVITGSGRSIELMDRCLEDALCLVPHGPKSLPNLYLLRFAGVHGVVQLDESTYIDDKKLVHTLQRSGIQVHVCHSLRTTAALIRQCVSATLFSYTAFFYAGWKFKDGQPVFSTFPPFSTHRADDLLASPRPASVSSEEAAALAVERFSEVFCAIRTPKLKWLVTVWYHAAFLFSLLEHGDASLPMGLCFFAEDFRIQFWLHQLLTWYGDTPISLDDRPNDVANALWQRKDQPVFLTDHHQTVNADKNVRLVEEVLASGKIFFRDGREEKSVPPRGPITLICDAVSCLLCSSSILAIDVHVEDFHKDLCYQQCEHFPANPEYLRVFASHAASHWEDLKKAIHKGRFQAFSLLPSGSPQSLTALGTLLGIAFFLDDFYKSYQIRDLFLADEGLLEAVSQLFSRNSSNASGPDIALQFCLVARMCLERQLFTLCEDGPSHSDAAKPLVYIAGDDYGFSREAFQEVCRRMGQSSPTVAHALAEAGVFRGKSTNSTTVQTRIPVCNANGDVQWIGVYRIAQEDILAPMF